MQHWMTLLAQGIQQSKAAYERLRDLSYWLFVGESVYQGGRPLEPL
jgi:hypothetical protein